MLSSHKFATSSFSLESYLIKYESFILAGIFFLSLLLRLLHLEQINKNDPFFYLPSIDARMYHEWAIEISQKDWLGKEVFYNNPLYPYFLAIVYTIFGVNIFIATFIQFLIGSLSCILIYLLAKKIFNLKVALIAGLIAALYGMFIFYDGLLLIVNLQTLLNLILIFTLLNSFESPQKKRWLLSGICLGLSALATPNILLFVLFVLFWIFYIFKNSLKFNRIFQFGLFFLLGIGLIVFPVTLRNFILGKDFVLINSQGGVIFFLGNNRDASGTFSIPRMFLRTNIDDPIEQRDSFKAYAEKQLGKELKPSEVSSYWFSQGVKFIKEQPGMWIKLLIKKLGFILNHYEIWDNYSYYFSRQFSWVLRLPLLNFGIVTPFALLGILITIRDWKRFFLLYTFILSYILSGLLLFVNSRYRMPIVPIFIIFAAYAIYWLFKTFQAKKILNSSGALLPLTLFFVIVHLNLINQSHSMAYYNLANRYVKMNKWDLAIEQYKRSIEIDPDYISAHNNLAYVYQMKLNWDEAIKEWEIVLKIAKARREEEYIRRALINLKRLHEITSNRKPGS